MLRAGLYIRVSTEEQALHGYSLEAQRDALTRYAKEHDLYIEDYYTDEGASARKPYNKRPEFMRMLEDVKSDNLDLILFIKLDRWFRSVRDYYKIQEILEAHHVDWKAILENYDTTTAAGRLHINIMLSVAQDEADRTSERIKFVFQERLRRGEFASGAIPFGYKLEDKHLVIDLEKAPIVRELFENYNANHNINWATRILREQYGINYYCGSVKRLLLKPVYKGEYKGIKDFCEPIVSNELYEQVKQALESNNIKACPSGRIYLFSGLMYCDCGGKMKGTSSSGKYYYRCRDSAEDLCSHKKFVSEEKLEKFLLENLTPELENQINDMKVMSAQYKRQGPNKAQIKTKLGRLKELYVNGLIDIDLYRQDYDKLTAQLQEIDDQPQLPKNIAHLEKILTANPLQRYEIRSREERQSLWHSILRGIKVDSNNNVVSIIFR